MWLEEPDKLGLWVVRREIQDNVSSTHLVYIATPERLAELQNRKYFPGDVSKLYFYVPPVEKYENGSTID
jgi:hypothetical protein